MGSMAGSERLVRLALYVREHPGTTFSEIADALPGAYGGAGRVAMRRRFERDKEELREYGVFFEADSAGRYRIDDEASYAAPVELTDAQASLLRLLCDALLEDPGYPMKNELRMVLAKIGDSIGVPDLLPSMEGGAGGGGGPVAGLEKVRRAIVARKRLRFDYRDAHGKPSRREVEPFGCFLLDRNCYVVAFDPAADGERVFRLDRMKKMSVNPKSPTSPDFRERPFDASRYYGLPFQFGGEAIPAEVRFDPESAWRAERLGRKQGSFETREDGSVVWTVETRDAAALARWCIENGPGIVPLSPESARDAYTAGLRAALGALDAAGEAE